MTSSYNFKATNDFYFFWIILFRKNKSYMRDETVSTY
jgi:hypothetical protein